MKYGTLLSSQFVIAILATFVAAISYPAGAQIIGSQKPTVIIREIPTEPFKTIYFVYDGSLSEMVAAEEQAKKFLEDKKITVLGASGDISSIDQLSEEKNKEKINARILKNPMPCVILLIQKTKFSGPEINFRFSFLNGDASGSVAVGEMIINTNKQFTISESSSLSLRVAARDVVKRLFSNDDVMKLFEK